MDDKTILVTIMAANNEIGVLQPIARNRQDLSRARRALPHRRGAGRRQGSVQRDQDNIDLASITGAQDLRSQGRRRAVRSPQESARADCRAMIDGGGHERGMRSGTLNVPGIVGLGKACAIAHEEMAQEAKQAARPARPSERPHHGPAGRGLHQRLDGAPPARQPEHQLCLRRRRVAADGHQRHRGFQRIGLHLCDA